MHRTVRKPRSNEVMVCRDGRTTGPELLLPVDLPWSSLGRLDWSQMQPITGAVTLTPASVGKAYVCTGTSADYTVSLPTTGMRTGDLLAFVMGTSSTLTKLVTLDAGSGKTIDGQQTRVMWSNEVAIIVFNGTNWTKVSGKTIPMICSMVPSGNQTLSSNLTIIKLTLSGTPEVDVGLLADTANSKIVIRRAGKYLITGNVLYESASGTVTGFNGAASRIHLNGSFFSTIILYHPTTIQRPNPTITSPGNLAAGDYLELNAYMDCMGTFSNQSTLVSIAAFLSRLMVEELPGW